MAEKVLSQSTYLFVLLGLLVLTLATFVAAKIDLGKVNFIVAMLIAGGKAALVTLYFMHARYSERITRVVIGAGLMWLAILMVLTLADYATRTQF
jgi:cytochrome c oxidase subunit 4